MAGDDGKKKAGDANDDGSKGSPKSAAGQGRELAVARQFTPVVSGHANVPPLTRTNYAEWSLLMEVGMQASGMSRAILGAEDLDDEYGYRNDKGAMEFILRSVPPKMLPMLRKHQTSQELWEALRAMRAGSVRVRDAKAQTLRGEFDQLRHKPGESIDDLAMRLTGLCARLGELGDAISDKRVIQKWLRIVPKRYSQLAVSIDNLVDLDTTSIEEIIGRFKAAEERYELDAEEEGGSKLLFTLEEWNAWLGRGDQGG